MEINLRNIYKEYQDGKDKLVVLSNINLHIKSGEFVAIVGASGSGKSTLLQIIGMLLSPEKGAYFLDDFNVLEMKEKQKQIFRNQKLGFIVQNFALINEYSIYENIVLPLKYNTAINRSEYSKKINSILQELEILNRRETIVNKLSGGQQQRVAIARALINDPDILLADEPTGSLDNDNSIKVMEILKKYNAMGKTIVIVTHDDEIAKQCDKIIFLKDGGIVGGVTDANKE